VGVLNFERELAKRMYEEAVQKAQAERLPEPPPFEEAMGDV
jgi:hypothetical protein